MPVMLKIDLRSPTIWVPALVFLLAAGIRLWSLSSPPAMYWDERYYVFDAEVYLGGGIGQFVGHPPAVKIADEGTWMHPPLGKWMIALLGVGPIGLRSMGWRLPSALFGIAGVVLLYVIALRLWRSVWWAGLASLLLALDGLHIVQSRIAMLDIFLSTFILAATLFMVLDRERMDDPERESRWKRTSSVFGSPYRFWAGFFLGAAVATKWSGALALAGAAVLCTAWLFTGGRRKGQPTGAAVASLAASFVLVPLSVYLLSYGAFFYQHGPDIADFITLQLRMFQFQRTYVHLHGQGSPAWTWPLLLHPIQYYRSTSGGPVHTIVALGNPALWWGFLPLLPVGAVTLARRATWREALVFGGVAILYLPWLAVSRTQFIFYMLPVVPFMCLGVAGTLRKLPVVAARRLGIAFAVATGGAAVLFMPVWVGACISGAWAAQLKLLPGWPL